MQKIQRILKLESLLLFLSTLALYSHNNFNFTWYLVFFLLPDLSAIGYIWGNRVGALAYNVGHSLTLAYALIIIGLLGNIHLLLATGIIWVGHISFDRMLGYGLKLDSGFNDTSLGKIGRKLG